MKKLILVVLMIATLSACTAGVYANRGNASIIRSKPVSAETVELTIQKDSGEVVTLTRGHNGKAAVGARVHLIEDGEQPDIVLVNRYDFK